MIWYFENGTVYTNIVTACLGIFHFAAIREEGSGT